MDEIFDSAVRTTVDLTGVFDCIDGKKHEDIFSPTSELKLPLSVADWLRDHS